VHHKAREGSVLGMDPRDFMLLLQMTDIGNHRHHSMGESKQHNGETQKGEGGNAAEA
jgi:hypothetical protein